jgi:hypothetical protein
MIWLVALAVAGLQLAYLAYLIRHARRYRAAYRDWLEADERRAREELGYSNGHVDVVRIERSMTAYLTATRYGLTHIEPTEVQRASGWRQVWRHPSGMLAMRHPVTGYWVISDGYEIADEGFSSSLRTAARRIERS